MQKEENKHASAPLVHIDSQIVKALLKSFLPILETAYEELLKLSPAEAARLLQQTDTPTAEVTGSVKLDESELDAEFREYLGELARLSLQIQRRVQDIASRAPIDEESEDYQAFLVKMAEEAMKSERIYLGRDELHKLFE